MQENSAKRKSEVADKSKQSVREELVGKWVSVKEECEPDSEETSRKKWPKETLILQADGSYKLEGDGQSDIADQMNVISGKFLVNTNIDEMGLQLDQAGSMRNFTLVDGHLENWREGDAVYPCGTIFERQE